MNNKNLQDPEQEPKLDSSAKEVEVTILSEKKEIPPLLKRERGMKKNVVTLNKIIKWCIYIFVVLLPLWFLPITSNILGLNKQVLMIGVLTVALIAWLGKLLTQEKIEWYKGLVVVLFLAFVVVYGLATVLSLRPYDSLMGFDTHLSRALINVIYFFIFFLLLVNYREEEEGEPKAEKNIGILKLLTVFLVSSAIVGVVGLLQIFGKFIFPWDFTKAASFNTIGTITSLGIFFAVLLPLVLSLLLGLKPKEGKGEKTILIGFKVFLAALAILAFIVILLLNFRTLWIITAVGMIMIVGFWLSKRHALSFQSLNWLTIPVIILAFCLIFLLFKPGVLFNLNLPIELGLSYKGGIGIVKEVIQHSPILGSGPETFVYNYSLYKPESINQTIFWNLRFTNAPAEILSLLSEIGILGILSFLVLIAVFLFKVIKSLISSEKGLGQLTEVKIGLFSSWLALMVGWFLYPQNTTLMFVFWLFFALLIIVSSERKDIKVINLRTSNKIASIVSFGFIILMIAVIGFLYLEGSKFIAEAKHKAGFELIRKGELDSGIDKVVRTTVINPYEDKFYRDLAQLFLIQINQDLNNPELDQEERTNRVQMGINNAINSAVRATTLNPKDVVNWIIRGSVYRNLITLVEGAGVWAVDSYEEALKLEPINPFIYLEIARTYVNEADLLRNQAREDETVKKQMTSYLNKAIETYNNTIELKSNYSPAHFEVALVYDRQGKIDEAIAKMENSKMLVPRDTGVAFQLAVLYYKDSQFDKAKAEFTRTIALDENFANARYFLGLLYDREGNKAAAIEQFEKIAELNPDNDLVKQILANLRAGQPALGSPELGPPEQPEEIPIEEKQPEELRP